MNQEYIRALLQLTKATSKDVIEATIEHLCEGVSQTKAAEAHNVKQEAVARMAKRLRELDRLVMEAAKKHAKIVMEAAKRHAKEW